MRPAVFARASNAYLPDGRIVMPEAPRLVPGRFGQAVQVEEASANLLTVNQSSMEESDAGFMNVGSSRSRSAEHSVHGSFSLRCLPSGAGQWEGVRLTDTAILPNTWYTYSAWVLAPAGAPLRLEIQELTSGLSIIGSVPVDYSGTGAWMRVTFSRLSAPTAAFVRFFMVRTRTIQTAPIFIDCVQIEQVSYTTSWILGGTTRAAETLTIPTANVFSLSSGTVEVWLNPRTLRDNNNFFSMPGLSTGRFLLQFFADGRVGWDFGASNDLISSAGLAVIWQWLHVAMRWDAVLATRQLFVGGVLRGSRPYTPPASLPADVGIVNNFSAFADDLRISNIARSDGEIAASAAAPAVADANTTWLQKFDRRRVVA